MNKVHAPAIQFTIYRVPSADNHVLYIPSHIAQPSSDFGSALPGIIEELGALPCSLVESRYVGADGCAGLVMVKSKSNPRNVISAFEMSVRNSMNSLPTSGRRPKDKVGGAEVQARPKRIRNRCWSICFSVKHRDVQDTDPAATGHIV